VQPAGNIVRGRIGAERVEASGNLDIATDYPTR
jgi:hypothetical protein